MKKQVLYIGGFEMPDGNAAAPRVLSIAKTIGDSFDVEFLGLTHSDNFEGYADVFGYHNLSYPRTIKEWLVHLCGNRELNWLKRQHPDIVIAYNFPAIGLWRISRHCTKNGIKIVGDITEWYHPHNILKWIDTTWRMKRLNKKMDGLIVISNYLQKYYQHQNCFQMPPTVDVEDVMWKTSEKSDNSDKITLMYAGSPGRGDKDRLEGLIAVIGKYNNLFLNIVGVTKLQYIEKFPDVSVPDNVRFWGRQFHDKTVEMLCRSDFSVFFRQPSRVNNAGFPTKFAEAQSAGVPVISNHFSDLDAQIENGKNGFLAKDITEEEIDKVLSRVAQLSMNEIEEMRLYTKSLNRFDYRAYIKLLTQFIKEL